MFGNSENSRITLAVAASILCILLAVLGTFATSGFLGIVLVAAGFILTVVSIAWFPFVADRLELDQFLCGAFCQSVLALLYGGIVFQWWGFAFAAGTLVVYMVSAVIRQDKWKR